VPLREALEHDRLLSSARVLAALGDALVAAHPNGPAEPLAGGRRLPGLYRLMAHPVQRAQQCKRGAACRPPARRARSGALAARRTWARRGRWRACCTTGHVRCRRG